MQQRQRLWLMTAAFCVVAGWAIFWGPAPKTNDPATRFPAHLTAAQGRMPPGFASDQRCAECHEKLARSFADSGMGRSWATWNDARPTENRDSPSKPVRLGDLVYRVHFDDGRLIQTESRVDAEGRETELTRREAAYVLGSGHKGRAYIAAEHGWLTILPLGWYEETKVWDMNPGYRQLNLRFDRSVQSGCLACHNAMTAEQPFSKNAFVEPLPSGIGCQRCHGPGAEHIAWHEAGGGPRDRDPIVNPARLTVDLQQDICLQCHLQGDFSAPAPGRDAWSFRTGQRLRDHRVVFFYASKANDFTAVGHGPRSMASACYRASGGKMTCALCHDPHQDVSKTPRDAYNRRCNECHERQTCSRPLAANERARGGDCAACHMPKRSATDVPHTVSTEHWIHRPGQKLGAPIRFPSNDKDQLIAFWPDTALGQRRAAEVMFYVDRDATEKLRPAVAALEATLTADDPAEWWEALGVGHLHLGDPGTALRAAEKALAKSPDHPRLRQLMARAHVGLGQAKPARRLLEESVRQFPWFDGGDRLLATLMLHDKEYDHLLELERTTLRYHGPDANRLTVMARATEMAPRPHAEIEAAWQRAAAADGAQAAPHLALAGHAVRRDDAAAVDRHLSAAVAAEANATTRLARARFFLSQRRPLEARRELALALEHEPGNRAALDLDRQLRRMGLP